LFQRLSSKSDHGISILCDGIEGSSGSPDDNLIFLRLDRPDIDRMGKRAILATPSLAVGLALTDFARSVIKEENRNNKKRRRSSSAAGAADTVTKVQDWGEGQKLRVAESGAESSSNRTEKRKRQIGEADDDGTERAERPLWVEPICGGSSNEDATGENDAAEGTYLLLKLISSVIS
jgi:hypothetical protein